jgi:hypothetical protein
MGLTYHNPTTYPRFYILFHYSSPLPFSCCPQRSDTDIPVICAVNCAIVFPLSTHVGTSATYSYTYMFGSLPTPLQLSVSILPTKMTLMTKSDPAIQFTTSLLYSFPPSPSSYNIMFLFNLNSIMIQVLLRI